MAGTVRFTGAVPSGDSKIFKGAPNKTMDAVSIEVRGGRIITLMPFSSIGVAEGQAVAEGQSLGSLAASGDASSAGAHVHMGYKSGSTYLDPMLLFGASIQSASESSGQPSGAVAGESPAAGLANPGTAPSLLDSLQSEGAVDLPALSEQPAAESPAANASDSAFNSIETGAYELDARAGAASSPVGTLDGVLAQLGDACSEQLVSFTDALSALSKGTGIPLPALFAIIPAAAVSAVVALGVVGVRLLVPRVGSMLSLSRAAVMGAEAQEHFACH